MRHAFAGIGSHWQRALAAQITKGQNSGQIRRDADPKMEAQLLIAAVRGLRLQSMLSPGEGSIAEAIAALKLHLRRRLGLHMTSAA